MQIVLLHEEEDQHDGGREDFEKAHIFRIPKAFADNGATFDDKLERADKKEDPPADKLKFFVRGKIGKNYVRPKRKEDQLKVDGNAK